MTYPYDIKHVPPEMFFVCRSTRIYKHRSITHSADSFTLYLLARNLTDVRPLDSLYDHLSNLFMNHTVKISIKVGHNWLFYTEDSKETVVFMMEHLNSLNYDMKVTITCA